MNPRAGLTACAVVLVVASAGWGQVEQPDDVETVVAIRGARIVPVDAPVIERGNLIIRDGLIDALGPDVAIPAGAAVIDASGQTLYPGLIDGLTTLGLIEIDSVPGSVDTEEVGDVNPQARARVALHPHSALIPVTRANGITMALAAPDGGLVSGQSVLLRLTGSTPAALTVREPVALHIQQPTGREPFDFARFFEEPKLRTLEERQKQRREQERKDLRRLHHLLEDARAHGAALDAAAAGTREPPKPNLVLRALAPAARGELPVAVRADDEEHIRAAVAFASEHGLRLILVGGLEAWKCVDVLKEHDVPVLLQVDRLPRRESEAYDAAYANPRRLHEAGVRFAIVTDDASNSRNLPYQAAMARSHGLSADAALRAITLSPAEIFGVADRAGSLAPGKDADLVLATGDIMDHRSRVTRVFIQGKPQSLETRHTRLYEAFKDRP